MSLKDAIELAAALAAIVTGVVAVLAYGGYVRERRARRRRLEDFLKTERGCQQSKFSVLELMAMLRMTEAQILEAGFASDKVRCASPAYWNGPAGSLILEYEESDEELQALRF